MNEYIRKRDFSKTPEPRGGKTRLHVRPVFVIQEHHASHLHFDFRIEANGALKSWAVPKGVSLVVGEKRLAVKTEDHPLAYAIFEGVIPEGEYGAGRVSIWDRGYYENLSHYNENLKAVDDCLNDGHLVIKLVGAKIQGDYAMHRFRNTKKEHWLLIRLK